MHRVGIWQVTEDGPRKIKPGGIDLEQHLEGWIADDPSLLQEGLVIVGRQIHLEGGRLDLLGLDPQGRWVVIEIKSGRVRRETVAQALDYASCIATMAVDELRQKVDAYLQSRGTALETLLTEQGGQSDIEEAPRDVAIYLVGTGREPGLERMIDFLASYEMPVTFVSYEVFEGEGSQRILVRELAEAETTMPPEKPASLEDIRAKAGRAGVGRQFEAVLDAATRLGLHPRPYKWSLMFTHPSDRTRMLFTVAVRPKADRLLRMYVGPEAFAQFYSVNEESVTSLLGPEGWRRMSVADVEQFVANLDRLFAGIEQAE